MLSIKIVETELGLSTGNGLCTRGNITFTAKGKRRNGTDRIELTATHRLDESRLEYNSCGDDFMTLNSQ